MSSAAGLLYLYWQPRAELRTLVWWMLPLGWLGVGAAIGTGLIAQAGLPPQAPYRSLLNWHISSGLTLLILYAGLLYVRWLRRHKRKPTKHNVSQPVDSADPLLDDPNARWWLTLLFLLGIGLVVASGWNGGRLVYEWGVNVRAF
ncbi:MAG: DUF2231 domain-containing protein [Caldilineaceae bacterium]|nr:DUF2231 domain-containing protein [Caldilineaceae bacterium]